MRRLLFVLLILAALMAGGRFALAADMNQTTSGENVTVSIASPFTDVPPGGCVPYTATIRNDRNSPGTWRLFFQGSSMSGVGSSYYAQDLTVAANSSATFDLLVPVPGGSNRGGVNLSAGVNGPGFDNRIFAYIYNNNFNAKSPFTVIGKNVLGAIGIGPLEASYKDRNSSFYGSVADAKELPSDWRAFAGVAAMILKDSEWLGLSTAQRQAVCDYVAQGGELTLLTSDDVETRIPQLQLPETDGRPGRYGFGKISLESVPGFPPDVVTLTHIIDTNHVTTPDNVDADFSIWELRGLIGTIAVSGAFILAFVLLFGALVGPINLFVFARGRKRFRLFWTTPLISILASFALIVGILIVDGIGGTGKQMAVFYSLPESNREAVVQEQIARTALLFSSRWHSDQNYLITPLSARAVKSESGQAGYRNAARDMSSSPDVFHQEGDTFSGNWFRSRAISGQYLQAMRPTRSSITVVNAAAIDGGGAAPEILSSYPHDLDKVFLVDKQNRYWICGLLEPGRKQVCSQTTRGEFARFWTDAAKLAGGKLRPFLSDVGDQPGCFYAIGPVSSKETLATLGGIRWSVAQGIYLGPWVAAPATGGTP